MRFICILLLCLLSLPAYAGTCFSSGIKKGVNLDGGSFYNENRWPGQLWHDYHYPTDAMIQKVKDAGFDTIRVPFKTQRIMPGGWNTAFGPDFAHMQRIANKAAVLNLCVVFDAHDYGSVYGQKLSDGTTNGRNARNFWRNFSRSVGHVDHVALGLMNEPHRVSRDYWQRFADYVIPGLRADGVRNLVMLAGPGWGSLASYGGDFKDFADDKTVIELHGYFDSGDGGNASSSSCLSKLHYWKRVIERQPTRKYFIGEFGIHAREECQRYLKEVVDLMNANPGTFWGWAYWKVDAWNPTEVYGYSLNAKSGAWSRQYYTLFGTSPAP